MNLPTELHTQIVEFLSGLPNVDDSGGRRALILQANLDTQLYSQIDWEGPPAQFFPILVDTMLRFDGCQSIEALLRTAKRSVGPGKQQTCGALITALHQLPKEPAHRATPKPIPRHLPPPDDRFVDRKQQIAFLLQEFHPGKVITLCGPGGIGKSALAAQAVHRLEPDRFPDGILFHSFYKQPASDLALEYIARTFGADPTPTPAMAAQLALAGKQALLILDGAEDADDLQAVLNVRGQCGVLITTRDKHQSLTLRVDIPPLHAAASQELLEKWGGTSQHGDAARARICELLGGLPLAIRLVGHYLDDTGETAKEYLKWLEAQPLEALDHSQHRLESVNSLLSRSVAQVSPEAGRALAVAGLLAFAPFAVEPIAAALDCAQRQCRTALGELVRYGLLLRSGECYEISHALVHAYAYSMAEAETLERLCEYYTTFAREQQECGLDGYARLDGERAHILHLLKRCRKQVQRQAVSPLVKAIDTYLDRQGHWTDRLTALDINLHTAQQTQDYKDEGWCLSELGNNCYKCGNYAMALSYLKRSLAIYQEIGNKTGEGETLNDLSQIYKAQGDSARALTYLEQSLVIFQEIGDKDGEGTTLNNLGQIYQARRDYDTALTYLEQSLAIAQEAGDKDGEGTTLNNIGLIYRERDDNATALQYLKQSLAICQEIGDKAGQGTRLNNISQIYQARRDYDTALTYLEQSLAIQQEIGDKTGEGTTLNNLATTAYARGDYVTALQYLEQSLVIFQKIGDKDGEGRTLKNIGQIYQAQGDYATASQYLDQSLAIRQEIGDETGEAMTCWNIGRMYEEQGDLFKAEEYISRAVEIGEQIGHPVLGQKRPELERIRRKLYKD